VSLLRIVPFLFLMCVQVALAQETSFEEDVREAVRTFGRAFVEADVPVVRSMLTEDYVHVNGGSGNVIDRERWLAWIASRRVELDRGDLVIDTYRVDEVKVEMHGETAIVTGVVHSTGRRRSEAFTSRIRFTNVWTEQDGVWRRAAFHDSRLPESALSSIIELRLAGQLGAAREQVDAELHQKDLTPRDEVALRLELAKIHDRVGLHTNTRPVEAALQEIERADAIAAGLDAAARGAVEAAMATYYYRAEMAERTFTKATDHVQRAIVLLEEAGDTRAQSDAVHLLGLIHLQKREFHRARELFDESLVLDERAGARLWMRGEYHRHVGFIPAMSGDWKAALPHFEKSLQFRKEAGAIDASLFAAISLATALIRTGKGQDAESHLQYAMAIADDIPSPVGRARAAAALELLEEMER